MTSFIQSPASKEVECVRIGFEDEDQDETEDTKLSHLDRYFSESIVGMPALGCASTNLTGSETGSTLQQVALQASTYRNIDQHPFNEIVGNVLGEIAAGRACPKLQLLILQLPLTSDFFQSPSATRHLSSEISSDLSPLSLLSSVFAVTPSSHEDGNKFMRRLTHLHISVFKDVATFHDDHFWRPLTFGLSLFGLVTRLNHLQHFWMDGHYNIDMDLLDSPNFCNLKQIRLGYFQVSCEALSRLVKVRLSSTLEILHLTSLHLKTGTWESIFLDLCNLQKLIDLSVNALRYDKRGTSRDLTGSTIDAPFEMESGRLGDYEALGALQRHVNDSRKKAGRKPHNESHFGMLKGVPSWIFGYLG